MRNNSVDIYWKSTGFHTIVHFFAGLRFHYCHLIRSGYARCNHIAAKDTNYSFRKVYDRKIYSNLTNRTIETTKTKKKTSEERGTSRAAPKFISYILFVFSFAGTTTNFLQFFRRLCALTFTWKKSKKREEISRNKNGWGFSFILSVVSFEVCIIR